MKIQTRKYKGFTLAEISIALSVGAIIVVMTFFAFSNVYKLFNNKVYYSNLWADYDNLKQFVTNFENENMGNVQVLQDNKIIYNVSAEQKNVLEFSNNQIYINQEEKQAYQTIKKIQIVESFVQVEFTNNEKLKFNIG